MHTGGHKPGVELDSVSAHPAPAPHEHAEATPLPLVRIEEKHPAGSGEDPEPADPAIRAQPVREGFEPVDPAVRVQPVPGDAVRAVPVQGGMEMERIALRDTLGDRYDAAAGAVSRVMAESPGLRAGGTASAAVDDLTAVFVYLSGAVDAVDDHVRQGVAGPHVAVARCIASGLRRLPSYRGATFMRAMLTDAERAWYRAGAVVTDWGFCGALTTARPGLPGNTDILIWSRTGRRTALIHPHIPDRVLFLPGTMFKVLDSSGGERHQIVLRELAPAEAAGTGRPEATVSLDEVAAAGLRGAEEALRNARGVEPLPVAYQWAFTAPPGLIPQTGPPQTAGGPADGEGPPLRGEAVRP